MRISTVADSNINAAAFWLGAAGSWARDGNLKAIFGRDTGSRAAASGCSGNAGWLVFRMKLAVK
jgi:hypothetical protein